MFTGPPNDVLGTESHPAIINSSKRFSSRPAASEVTPALLEDYQVQKAIEISLLQKEIVELKNSNGLLRNNSNTIGGSSEIGLSKVELHQAYLAERQLRIDSELYYKEYQNKFEKLEQELSNKPSQEMQEGLTIVKREKEQIEMKYDILDSKYLLSTRTIEDLKKKLGEKENEVSELKRYQDKSQNVSLEDDNNVAALRQQIQSLHTQITQCDNHAAEARVYYENIIDQMNADINEGVNEAPIFDIDEHYIVNEHNDPSKYNKSPMPVCPINVDRDMWDKFQKNDQALSGVLDAGQLRQALSNGIYL
jgi:FtsZ-binding cell division protein ZapB